MSATRAYFSVENYQGSKVAQRRRTRDINEAFRWAKETPDSTVEIQDGKGWVKGTAYFSAKHPPSVDGIRAKVRTHFKRNPAKRSYVSRPSQITKRAPTKRLKKRRAKNVAKPRKGFFPNPKKPRVVSLVQYVITARRSKTSPKMTFDGKNFSQRKEVEHFARDELALKKAQQLVKQYPILRKYRVAIETRVTRHRNP